MIKEQRYNKYYYRGNNSNYIFWYDNLRFRIFWERRLKILNKVVDSGKLLDVGCAFGFFIKLLERKFDVYGIDISEYAIREAEKTISEASRLKIFDVEKGIPFDGEFDAITAFDIMEHVLDPRSVLMSFNKSLKDGGYLYLEMPLSRTFINRDVGHHYRALEEWKGFLSHTGFELHFVQSYYTNGFRVIMVPSQRPANYCSIIAKKR